MKFVGCWRQKKRKNIKHALEIEAILVELETKLLVSKRISCIFGDEPSKVSLSTKLPSKESLPAASSSDRPR